MGERRGSLDALGKWDQLCVPCKSIHHNNSINVITKPIFYSVCVCVCVCVCVVVYVFGVERRRLVMSSVTYLPKAADVTLRYSNCSDVFAQLTVIDILSLPIHNRTELADFVYKAQFIVYKSFSQSTF